MCMLVLADTDLATVRALVFVMNSSLCPRFFTFIDHKAISFIMYFQFVLRIIMLQIDLATVRALIFVMNSSLCT